MATTFSLTSNSYDGRSMTLSCTQTKNSNNTSTINWTLTVSGGSVNYYSTGPTTVTINGTQVYYKDRTSYSSQAFPAAKGSTSGSLTVTHNTNGSKSIAVSLSTAIYNSTVTTKSGTWTLDSIASASTASVTSGNAGEYTTCVISAANSSFKHDVEFTFYNETTSIGTNLSSGTTRFIIPDRYNDILAAMGLTRGVAVVTCKTYSGSSLVGTTSSTFTIYAQDTSGPEVSLDAYDTNSTIVDLTGDKYTMIPGYSDIYYVITATSSNSTVSSYRATNGSYGKTTQTGTFTAATSPTVSATATDARGNSGRDSITLDVVDYIPLTCNIQSSNMSTSGGMTITVTGNYFNSSFGAKSNTLTVYYRYKLSTGSYGSWTAVTATKSGNTYTATANVSGLNPEATYVFQGRAVDRLEDVTSGSNNVQNKPVFDWSGTDFNFNVPVHFAAGFTTESGEGGNTGGGGITNGTIEGDVKITGDLTLKGSGNYGNTLYFGDGNYAYIQEASDDELTIHAGNVHLSDNVYLRSGLLTGNTFTPSLNVSATYSVREGWYQIVGDTAVIGFLITATINSSYAQTKIEITGFPYDIDVRGCGGGTAYNCYMSAGHCFNSWWIEEDGTITGRSIPCNHTTAGNQSINSTVAYPTGGGSITLSGTISCRVTDTI